MRTVVCTSAPVTTVTGGAPTSPSAAASQPWRANTASRALARQVALAIVAPLTKPPPLPGGSPSSSTIHRSATSSRRAAVGDIAASAAFWSHAALNQAAAWAMGSVPPFTNPKNLGPALATVAGEPTSSSSASTSEGGRPAGGRSVSRRSRAATAAALGATLRSRSDSRYTSARRAASSSSPARPVSSIPTERSPGGSKAFSTRGCADCDGEPSNMANHHVVHPDRRNAHRHLPILTERAALRRGGTAARDSPRRSRRCELHISPAQRPIGRPAAEVARVVMHACHQ